MLLSSELYPDVNKDEKLSLHVINQSDSITSFNKYHETEESFKSSASLGKIDFLHPYDVSLQLNYKQILTIRVLPNKILITPIDIIVEKDDVGYLARTVDLPLYSHGDDLISAIDNIKHQIESVYEELMEDENFSEEWLNYKNFLKERIVDNT